MAVGGKKRITTTDSSKTKEILWLRIKVRVESAIP